MIRGSRATGCSTGATKGRPSAVRASVSKAEEIWIALPSAFQLSSYAQLEPAGSVLRLHCKAPLPDCLPSSEFNQCPIAAVEFMDVAMARSSKLVGSVTPVKIRTSQERRISKITGSRAAVKGFDFEELVALVNILRSLRDRKANDPRQYIFRAYADAFVDDLVIEAPDESRRWIQIRARKKVTWSKDLLQDFVDQRHERPDDALELCVDEEGKAADLRTHLRAPVDVYVDYVDIAWLDEAYESREMRNILLSLTREGEHEELLLNLWDWLARAWKRMKRDANLEEIVTAATSLSNGAIMSVVGLNSRLVRILDLLAEIKNMRFNADNSNLWYEFLALNGHVKSKGRVPWQLFLDTFDTVPKSVVEFDEGLERMSR